MFGNLLQQTGDAECHICNGNVALEHNLAINLIFVQEFNVSATPAAAQASHT